MCICVVRPCHMHTSTLAICIGRDGSIPSWYQGGVLYTLIQYKVVYEATDFRNYILGASPTENASQYYRLKNSILRSIMYNTKLSSYNIKSARIHIYIYFFSLAYSCLHAPPTTEIRESNKTLPRPGYRLVSEPSIPLLQFPPTPVPNAPFITTTRTIAQT